MEISTRFVQSLRPSGIRAITAQINEKNARGVKVASFAGGMPAKEYFPLEEMKQITNEIFEEEDGQVIQYAPSTGYMPLRETLAKYMKRFNVDTKPENIMIYEGSTQALSYITRAFLTDGGCVAVEAPSYTGALDIFHSYQTEIISIEMDDDGINLDSLEKILKTHDVKFIYTIPDFQNPSGRVTSIEKRKGIVRLAEKYNTFVLEDAPYALLKFDGNILPSIKSFDMDGHVIYIGSVSKVIAPGIRVGWTVGTELFTQQMVYIKMIDDLQVNNLAQRQVHKYLSQYDVDSHLQTVRSVYHQRMNLMIEAVRETFPFDTKVVVPDGGMFLWLELPEKFNTDKLFNRVFAEDIAYVPGNRFYPDSEQGLNCMRLNFVTSPEDVISNKVRRMGEIISSC